MVAQEEAAMADKAAAALATTEGVQELLGLPVLVVPETAMPEGVQAVVVVPGALVRGPLQAVQELELALAVLRWIGASPCPEETPTS